MQLVLVVKLIIWFIIMCGYFEYVLIFNFVLCSVVMVFRVFGISVECVLIFLICSGMKWLQMVVILLLVGMWLCVSEKCVVIVLLLYSVWMWFYLFRFMGLCVLFSVMVMLNLVNVLMKICVGVNELKLIMVLVQFRIVVLSCNGVLLGLRWFVFVWCVEIGEELFMFLFFFCLLLFCYDGL